MRCFTMAQKKDPCVELSKEYKLLLLCARTRMTEEIEEEIKSLVNPDIDWDQLLQLSTEHRLTPLLYWQLNSVCPDLVPSGVMESLKTYFNDNARKNLLLTGGLINILKLFESHKIQAIPYKGPILALQAYGNLAFRQFGDIDILVKKLEVVKIKELMISSGYKLYEPINVDDSYYMKLEPEYQFIDKNMDIIVEIKWNYHGNFFSLPEPDILSNELENIHMNNYKFPTFSPANQLLILCIHNAKHNWDGLSWICDLSEFLKSQRDIEWSEILEKAEKLCIKRVLLINLKLAVDLFELKIPDEISYLMNDDKYVKKVSNQVKNRFFQEKDKSLNIVDKFILDLTKREKIKYGLMDCVKGLTRPTYLDFKDVSLPESLYPVYYLIRPFLLIKRYGKDTI